MTTTPSTTTIEIVTYRLKAGISKDQLADIHEAVNQLLSKQAGFFYRSNSEDQTGLIYDIVYWQSLEHAKAAGEAFMASSAGQSLIAICDESSITMEHMLVNAEAMSDCTKAA